jgi:nucleoid DNA-binding protein
VNDPIKYSDFIDEVARSLVNDPPINRNSNEPFDVKVGEARAFARRTVDVLLEQLQKGNGVTLQGLGVFEFQQKPAAQRYNPMYKTWVEKPAHLRPRFKFTKTTLKSILETVNQPPKAVDSDA